MNEKFSKSQQTRQTHGNVRQRGVNDFVVITCSNRRLAICVRYIECCMLCVVQCLPFTCKPHIQSYQFRFHFFHAADFYMKMTETRQLPIWIPQIEFYRSFSQQIWSWKIIESHCTELWNRQTNVRKKNESSTVSIFYSGRVTEWNCNFDMCQRNYAAG